MRGALMNDKFAPLGDDEAAQKTPAGDEWTPIVPVPDDAPEALAAIDAFAKFKGVSRTGLWQYTNAENRLLAFTARFDHPPNGGPCEKEFRQFTFCGNASGRREWRCKSLLAPRPLFGLGRLAKATTGPVLIVEGEKTAAAAATCFPGHVVVTSSHGAKSVRTADWLPLAGREAVIWPDHDTTGDGYAADVATIVSKSGAQSVRIVTVPPDFPDGWDLADKAPEGVNLRALLDAAPPWRNEPDERAQKARFELIPFDKIAFDTTPAYLVKGLIPRVGLCVFWGPPKCGKSFLVFDLMMHIALCWQYRGRRVRQGAVVYCALEGCAGFKNRVEAFRLTHLPDNAGEVPFHLMASPMSLDADHAALIASIRATLGDTKPAAPAAIAIDTLNRSLAGSESDDRDMAAYVKAADALRMAFDCAVVIVHHCGHEGTRPRGHSSLMGAIDAQIAVKRDAGDNIIVTVEFMKDGPQGDEFASRLEVVEIGLDDDGDRITSCVIVPVEGLAPQKEKPKKLPAAAVKALKALHEIIDDAGIIPPHDSYIPLATRAVTVEEWRAHTYKRGLGSSGEPDAKKHAFRRAFDCLVENHRIAVSEPYVWPLWGGKVISKAPE
jgi:AAA domain/Domain of unknown function (DUF6371)